jgi:fucose 4-O-acetylase-like acetyltransferase
MSLITPILENFSTSLSDTLEPIAEIFRSFNTPEPIVHWGHPLMMGIVVVVLGSYVAFAGWRGRLSDAQDVAIKSRLDHRKLAPLMFLFIALGYTGGVLSLVMQHKPILESPHFITGTIALILLATNGTIAATAFAKEKGIFRNIHAYLGSATLGLLFIHGLLGLKLGLSL